jgi:hypothetical protein
MTAKRCAERQGRPVQNSNNGNNSIQIIYFFKPTISTRNSTEQKMKNKKKPDMKNRKITQQQNDFLFLFRTLIKYTQFICSQEYSQRIPCFLMDY